MKLIIKKSKNGEYLNIDDPEFEEGALDCGCSERCTCEREDDCE